MVHSKPVLRLIALLGVCFALIVAIATFRDTGFVDTEDQLFPGATRRTENRLDIVATTIQTLFDSTGTLPDSLEALYDERPQVGNEPHRLPVDAWGIPLRYVPGDSCFELRSAGPDMVHETEDDILWIERLGERLKLERCR